MGAFAKRNWTPASIRIVSKLVSSYGARDGTRTRVKNAKNRCGSRRF